MFGFLNPRPQSFEYRRHYARMCAHQRRWYGLASLAFHSYEAVFLYQLAADAGAVPPGVLPDRRCCRLARRGDPGKDPDAAVGRFCASVGVLLASVKLDDDVRDAGSLLARAARFVLGGPIHRMRAYFDQLAPGFPAAVRDVIAEHHRLEAAGGHPPVGEYAGPTARAFGAVFGLMAKLPGLERRRDVFEEVGRAVGAAVIAFDCAADWVKDRRRGEYNPLPDEAAARGAMGTAADLLERAAGRCRAALGPDAGSTRTLAAVARRVGRTDPVGRAACPAAPGWAAVLAGLAARVFAPQPAPRLAPAGWAMSAGDPLDGGPLPGEGGLPGADEGESAAGAAARAAARRSSCWGDCFTGCCNGVDCCSGLDCNGCDGCNGCGDGCGGCDCNCN